MPTYEYACTQCGNRVEVFQRIDEEPLAVCERCGGTLRKVFHPAGIVFKGSGFYATDSRTKTKSKSKGGEGDGKADGGATRKSDSKDSKDSKESKATPTPEKPA